MYEELEKLIEITPDFPKQGIFFKDISPLLAQKFPEVIDALSAQFTKDEMDRIDAFAGIDARGFIFASALAAKHGKQMVMIRKDGKLPPPVMRESYNLEYGAAALAMKPGQGGRIALLDDVLATGGTLMASANLCLKAGYEVAHFVVLINLKFLNNFEWRGIRPRSVFAYDPKAPE